MAITVGEATTFDSGSAMLDSLSASVAIDLFSNILIVGIASEYAAGTAPIATEIRYNGSLLTKLVGARSNGEIYAEIWYMVNPSRGPTYTLSVTFDRSGRWALGAFGIGGVNPVTPFGASTFVNTGTTSTSTQATINVQAGGIALDILSVRSNNNNVTVKNDVNAQIPIWTDFSTNSTVTSNPTGYQAWKATSDGGAENVTMKYTWDYARVSSFILAAVNPMPEASFQPIWLY